MSSSAVAWEWEDFLGNSNDVLSSSKTNTLTMSEVREMRVRDIKRRLSRKHGYSAEELGRILDKKELIEALSFEEHKERRKEQDKIKRFLVIRGIIAALIAVVIVMGWPVWTHLWEVASINFVVYTDRKRHEASRCLELRSKTGMVGVLIMAIIDILQLWLTLSIMLSWFMSSRYFFPTPNFSIRPAQFMGGPIAHGPLAKYGVNVGPMVLTWMFRFFSARVEAWTGRALSRAHRQQRKEAKQWEDPEERKARKAARRAAKQAAREEEERKRREEEAARRRKAADDATLSLFRTKPTEGHVGDLPSGEDNSLDDDDAEDEFNTMLPEETRKSFQEQVESFNMDDLD